jgi:multimeric flavodoxin WrbA
MYARLDMADAWAIIGPVNWYGPTSNLKLMFDRLVCMNGGNQDEKLIDHKNPEKGILIRRIMALPKKRNWYYS